MANNHFSRFFAPQDLDNTDVASVYESLNSDGALDAYAETVLWRLKAAHVMVRYGARVFSFLYLMLTMHS